MAKIDSSLKLNPMNFQELFEKIRDTWLAHVLTRLARGTGTREDFRAQVERFLGILIQVITTGDPAWFDSVLVDWATSLTQTDLESSNSNLPGLLRQLFEVTYEVCRENLSEEEVLGITPSLIFAYSSAQERAAQLELRQKVDYFKNQLEQIQNTLEKLDRSKSDFIAVAAHELRTPLTLVEGYAAMLRENLPTQNGTSELREELINGIHNGTKRLRTIIDDMIDVSLIDTNLLSLNYQPVWLNRLFQVLKLELQTIVDERQQKLVVVDFAGASEMTFADPERLLQVFRNVLINAVKFTPDGGSIIVDGKKLPGFVDVTITDSGIGINPEDQQLIFEKFGRLGNTALHSSSKTKFKGGGPGLGLHIAKGIIEAHGGAIWVESTQYDEVTLPGSVFHILLPMHETPPDDKSTKLFNSLVQNK